MTGAAAIVQCGFFSLSGIGKAIQLGAAMNLQGVKITWLGHSTFFIQTPAGKRVLIDPWVQNNPACPADKKQLPGIDVMLCSHGHGDHIGDGVELAKKHNPVVIGAFELCMWMQKKGVKQISPMNKGGSQKAADIRVTMVHADHSCGIQDGEQIVYGGEACGYVVEFEKGLKLYHAGDTAVFSDMQLIRELYAPDLALLPIGDLFTMGPREAARACQFLRPKAVIPMHYGTFPMLTGTPNEFERMLADSKIELIVMQPGQAL